MKANYLIFFIILFFSLLGANALLHPGLYTAHDIWHQVARLYHYQQTVFAGIFPPYWVSNMANGYGYPLFFFSYSLPWLTGLPFLKIGFDVPTTIKILFFTAYFISGITMYIFSNTLLKNKLAALVSAIIYLWVPYHFLSILVSAAIGIVFTFIFPPVLLLGIYLAFNEKSNKGPILIALGIVGIALSHLITAFSLIPLTLIFIIYLFIKTKQNIRPGLKNLTAGLILGVAISSFYLIPAVYYSKLTKTTTDPGFTQLYQHNFINFKQLIYSKWGYGPIINNAKEGEISFQLGIAQWIAILGCLGLLLTPLSKNSKGLILSSLVAFVVSIAMMLDISRPIWDFLSKFASFDYPTRFMLPAVFLGSFCSAILISSLKKREFKITLSLFLVAIALYANRNHIRVNLYTNIPVSLYVSSELTTNTYNEYLPKNSDSRLLNKPYQVAEGNNLIINNFFQNTQGIGFNLTTSSEAPVSAGQYYFPGISTYLDNKRVTTNVDKQGRVQLVIPSGNHNLKIKFEDTNIIKASKVLSCLGLLALAFLLFKKKPVFN